MKKMYIEPSMKVSKTIVTSVICTSFGEGEGSLNKDQKIEEEDVATKGRNSYFDY